MPYKQLPTREELEQQLTEGLANGDLNKQQVLALIDQYKVDLDEYGVPLPQNIIDGIDKSINSGLTAFLPESMRMSMRDNMIQAEQFKITNPYEYEVIQNMNPVEVFGVGVGSGMMNIWRGITGEKASEFEKKAVEQLEKQRHGVSAGEIIGEAAPFVPFGVAAAGLKSLAGRVISGGAIGGAEGAIVARGGERDALKGAAIGTVVGTGVELVVPVLGRIAGSVWRRLTGENPMSDLVTKDGFSQEFVDVLESAGSNTDRFIGDVQKVVSATGDNEASGAIGMFAEAIKRQQGRNLRGIAAEPDIDPEVLKAAERLGIAGDLPLSAMSKNQKFIELEQGLSSIIGSDISARQVSAIKKMDETAQGIIRELGGTTDDAAGLGMRVKSNLETTRNDLQIKGDELYNIVGTKVPGERVIEDVSPIKDYIDERLKLVAGQYDKLDPLDKRLMSEFMGTEDKGVMVTYHMIDNMRKSIGEQLGRVSSPYPDASQASLDRVYGVLSDLQGNAIKEVDPSAYPVWEQGKSLVATRKKLEEELVKNFGKSGEKAIIPTLEAGVFKVSKGSIEEFNKAINIIPEDMRGEAVATALNRVFTAGGRKSQLNMGGFVDWFDNVNRNQSIKTELFNHISPEGRQRLEDLYLVSKGFRNALANKKDTGRVATLFDQFDQPNGFLDKLYFGGSTDPTASATSMVVRAAMGQKQPLSVAADRLLASPEFKRLVVSAANDPASAAANKQLKLVMESKVYNEWLDNLPKRGRAAVIANGLIPWIIGSTEEDNGGDE